MQQEFWKKRPELINLLMERRSTRKYTEESIPDEEISMILTAGIHAPNASNLQTWHFMVVTNRTMNQEIAAMVESAHDKMLDFLDDREAKKNIRYSKFYAAFFKDAPCVIYCLATPYFSKVVDFYAMMGEEGKIFVENRSVTNSGLQSVAAAIENMLLAAWALGIGGVWMTAPVVIRDQIERKLNVKEGKLVAVVALGYPAEPPREPVRKPLGEVVTFYR